jgi:uncharacterized membrane protein
MAAFSDIMTNENLLRFLSPKEYGYTVWTTLAYSLLLVIAAYIIYSVLKRLKVKIDDKLAVAISPYVVFGSCLRVIQDAGIVNSYLFVTPGIYVFIFSIFFAVLLVGWALQKKYGIEYYKSLFFIGLMMLPFTLSQLDYVNPRGGWMVVSFLVPWMLLFKLVRWSATNKIVSLLHLFDGTTTFVAMTFFGYYEQHIVPTFFINMFSPVSFIFLKLVAVVGVLYLIDRYAAEEEDREFGIYLKLIIGILGAATGTRDFITLVAGI